MRSTPSASATTSPLFVWKEGTPLLQELLPGVALPPDTTPDITRRSNFADRGGVGYSYLLDTFAPLASEAGVPDRAWENLLYRNALRIYKGQK